MDQTVRMQPGNMSVWHRPDTLLISMPVNQSVSDSHFRLIHKNSIILSLRLYTPRNTFYFHTYFIWKNHNFWRYSLNSIITRCFRCRLSCKNSGPSLQITWASTWNPISPSQTRPLPYPIRHTYLLYIFAYPLIYLITTYELTYLNAYLSTYCSLMLRLICFISLSLQILCYKWNMARTIIPPDTRWGNRNNYTAERSVDSRYYTPVLLQHKSITGWEVRINAETKC
jgi:hypothetical protein